MVVENEEFGGHKCKIQPLTSRPLFTRVGDLIGRCEPNLLKLDCAPAGRARKTVVWWLSV